MSSVHCSRCQICPTELSPLHVIAMGFG
jgi:hypothetical protein